MVIKQTTKYEMDGETRHFQPRFIAMTYDGHAVTFTVDQETEAISVESDLKNLTGQYRYIRQCSLFEDKVAFISETGHLDAKSHKGGAADSET